jgi:hypothetical protein
MNDTIYTLSKSDWLLCLGLSCAVVAGVFVTWLVLEVVLAWKRGG